MNPVVHMTMGLHAANLGFHQRYGARAPLILVAASIFPDIDSITLLLGRQAYFHYHRTFTHAVSGWVVCGAILALLTAHRDFGRWYLVDWSLWSLGMAGHTVADIITRWGIPLFYPFSEERWAIPIVSWGDGFLTSMWLAFAVAALVFTKYRRPISGAAWGLGLFYLAYRVLVPAPGTSWLSRLWFGFWLR